MVTPAEIARARSDFRYFCKTFLKIKPKRDDGGLGGGLVPFIWNTAQEIVWALMQLFIAQGVPIQLVICKARQVGISTLFMAWTFWRMWRGLNINCGLSSAEKPTYLAMMQMMTTFYDNLPEEMKPELRSPNSKARINLTSMEFIKQHCTFNTGTAKGDAFRGQNIDVAICTEVSSYREPDEFFDGFISCLSESPLTTFILESSPKDGYFWTKYNAAKAGEGGFRAAFLPWYILPDPYSRPLTRVGSKWTDARTQQPVFFDEDEKLEYKALNKLAKAEGHKEVTWPQMYWRQLQIEKKDGDIEWFDQEYPRDDRSCFMRSTSSAFRSVLEIVRASCEADDEYEGGEFYSLEPLENLSSMPLIQWVPEVREGLIDQDRHAGYYMFCDAVPGYTYTIGVDVASGTATGGGDEEDHAYSVASVYCCDTQTQVGEWRGRIEPYDLADEIAKLGYYYVGPNGPAMICVELNNMGRSTVDRLSRDLNYPNTFRWPKFDEQGVLTKKEHWETNMATKPILIESLRYRIRLGHFQVKSYGLYDEMVSYVVKGGRYKKTDKESDRIIAAALAWQCVEQTEFKYILSGQLSAQKLPEGVIRRSAMGVIAPNIKAPLPGIMEAANLRPSTNLESQFVEDIWGSRSTLV